MPCAVARRAQEVGRLDLRLAEEHVGALVGEGDQLAQDDAGRGRRESAELLELGLAVAGQVGEHRAQVAEVDERLVGLARVVEDEAQRRLLRLVEAEHLRQQQRAERVDGRADRDAGAEPTEREVLGGGGHRLPVLADALGALGELVVRHPGGRDARQVALDVGGEHRHAVRGHLLGQHLQRLGLARAGRPRHEPMAVQHAERDPHLRLGDGLAVDQRTDHQGRAVEGVARLDRLDDAAIRGGLARRLDARPSLGGRLRLDRRGGLPLLGGRGSLGELVGLLAGCLGRFLGCGRGLRRLLGGQGCVVVGRHALRLPSAIGRSCLH